MHKLVYSNNNNNNNNNSRSNDDNKNSNLFIRHKGHNKCNNT